MDIAKHPIWNQVTPYKTKIPSYKKPLHLLRIYLARQYAKLYSSDKFIGITGSVGKTTTTRLAHQVLAEKYNVLSTQTNLDPILNIPKTILRITPKVQKIILEMGIEYKGEMDFYLSLVQPKTAILTRIYFAHSEFLGEPENIIEEKGKLFKQLPKDGIAIVNYDDVYSRKVGEDCKAEVIWYGKDAKNCLVWAGNTRIENYKTIFELNYGVERVEVRFNLLGEHHVYLALAAASLGISENIPLVKIKHALEKVEVGEHRLQPVPGSGGSVILDDTYNSSPAAVEASIDALMQIPARRRIVVLGEMRELGLYSEKLHRQVARYLYKEKVDLVFLGGGETQFIADELKSLGFLDERLEYNLANSQIVQKLLKTLGKGDVCLIKGSRAVRLDEVVKRVTRKT